MTSILSSLKLSTAKRESFTNPIIQRRNKVISKLNEQVQLAEDPNFKAERTRKNRDDEQVNTITVLKSVKPCWFSVNDKTYVQVYYGNKVIPLNSKSDKNAIEITDKSDLVPTLKKLIDAVSNAELDQQIEAVSNTIRKRFKK